MSWDSPYSLFSLSFGFPGGMSSTFPDFCSDFTVTVTSERTPILNPYTWTSANHQPPSHILLSWYPLTVSFRLWAEILFHSACRFCQIKPRFGSILFLFVSHCVCAPIGWSIRPGFIWMYFQLTEAVIESLTIALPPRRIPTLSIQPRLVPASLRR